MLDVVGLGYNVGGHVTPESRSVLEQADRLFYLVTDPATAAWLRTLQPAAVSLHDCYRPGEAGIDASHRMVERILEPLTERLSVCAAFSGNPAIAMHTTHAAVARARALGFRARMFPAVSFEDCLVADLGIDPGQMGRMMYEATDFVLRPRPLDVTSALVLLQVGAIGERVYREGDAASRRGLRLLREVLGRSFPGDHEVTLYQAPQLPVADPEVVALPLDELERSPVHVNSTLYVPPLERPRRDPAMLARLGLQPLPVSRP
jgi:uncharacterized protein YabN with tetrapyrrole methylase and pyrophosphatase domain